MKKCIFLKYLIFIFSIQLIAYSSNANSDPVVVGSPEDPFPGAEVSTTTSTTVPACSPGEHRVEGQCCPLSMNYIDSVSGICSLCPTGQIFITSGSNSKCCNSGFSYLVNGECSECEATKTLSNGVCCSSGELGSNGICCPAGKVNTGGICCNPSQINSAGTCGCLAPKVNKNGICCANSEHNSEGHCCASGKDWASASGVCCASAKIADDRTCCVAPTPVLSRGICCPTGKVETDGICCANSEHNSEEHCCASGKDWASASSICCSSNKIADDQTCCQGTTPLLSNGHCCPANKVYTNGACQACVAPTPVFSNGICCPSGKVNKSGICCSSAQVNAAGICCPNNRPYNVSGACSDCKAAGRVKMAGSLEADKCCPTGNIVVQGGICCDSSMRYNVNGQCSAAPVCKFEVRGRSGSDFVHDPNYTAQTPTCLKNLITNGLAQCRTIWTGGYAIYADNCVASLLVENRYRTIADGRYRIDVGEDVTLYFDGSCNLVNAPAAGSSACDAGHYRFGASPIALLWDQSFSIEDLNENVSLVTFPIDPNQPNKLVEWKASSKAPLLVYDPTGEGKITSGYQLFGNWTFGPKKVASLKDKENNGKLWNNGFDALSKLDVNSDGEVSGTELEHLSLWFDGNRNAVSEKGEVLRVSAVGVKKLFYQGYANNDAVNAIVLNIGFERERNGKIEQGVMADWFAETVSSELEYAQKAMISSAFRKNDQIQSSVAASLNKISSHSPEITKDVIKDESELLANKKGAALVSGVWEWNSESEKIPVSGGTFLILDNEDGTISGITTIELPAESSIGAKSVGLVSSFKGKAKLEVDGSVSLTFELKAKDGTTILQSTAKLNKDGNSLEGSSSGEIRSEAAKTNISYSWVATKLRK